MSKKEILLDVPSFNGKPSLVDVKDRILPVITAVCDSYEFGRVKYHAYSWQSAPRDSFATPAINLDAMYRHLTLYKAGYDRDIEGYPHVYFIACRAAMVLGVWYHMFIHDEMDNYRKDNFKLVGDTLATHQSFMPLEHTEVCDIDLWSKVRKLQVSPYHTISVLKTYGNPKFLAEMDKHVPVIAVPTEKKKSKKAEVVSKDVVTPQTIMDYHTDMVQMLWWEVMNRYDENDPTALLPAHIVKGKSTVGLADLLVKEITYLDLLFYHALEVVRMTAVYPEFKHIHMDTETTYKLLDRYANSK